MIKLEGGPNDGQEVETPEYLGRWLLIPVAGGVLRYELVPPDGKRARFIAEESA